MQSISKQGQWLGDITVREAGSIEGLIDMAVKNEMSATDALEIGTLLQNPDPINKRVINYYKRNDIHPATASDYKGEQIGGGIGNMGIEINFVVS